MRVAVAYHSGSGHTTLLVETVVGALVGFGADAVAIDIDVIDDAGWKTLAAADAIIFAAPTYMGSVSAQMAAFMDASSNIWGSDPGWRDKIAGGITVATYPSGDKLSSLMQMAVFAAQHGMIWVGQGEIGAPVNPDKPGINEDGIWLGVGATSTRGEHIVRPGDVETARIFSRRIYDVTARFIGAA